MQEIDFENLDSGNFRLREAESFLGGYIGYVSPYTDFFPMICCLDAFLYILISIEEVVSPSIKNVLHQKDAFLFLKALRNTNAHHIVLGVGLKDSKWSNPTSYELTMNAEGPYAISIHRLHFDKLRQIFDATEKERPNRDKKTLDGARRFMSTFELQVNDFDLIENLMREGFKEVKSVLEKMPNKACT